MKPWEVYTLADPRTGVVRYVGVTCRSRRRLQEHLSKALNNGRTHREAWLRSLLTAGLQPIHAVIERGEGDGWQERERHWIAEYRRTCDLTNGTEGGEGLPGYSPSDELKAKWSRQRRGVKYAPGRKSAMLGRKLSPEACAQISARSSGKKHTPETRAKISAAAKGRPFTPEAIEKRRVTMAGRTLTPEHRAKIAASTKTRKPVLCVESGVVFESVKAAARALGVHPGRVCQALRKGCRCAGVHLRRV